MINLAGQMVRGGLVVGPRPLAVRGQGTVNSWNLQTAEAHKNAATGDFCYRRNVLSSTEYPTQATAVTQKKPTVVHITTINN